MAPRKTINSPKGWLNKYGDIGADDFPEVYQGVWVDAAGTISGADGDGTAFVDFPVQAGWNPGEISRVSASATITSLWVPKNRSENLG